MILISNILNSFLNNTQTTKIKMKSEIKKSFHSLQEHTHTHSEKKHKPTALKCMKKTFSLHRQQHKAFPRPFVSHLSRTIVDPERSTDKVQMDSLQPLVVETTPCICENVQEWVLMNTPRRTAPLCVCAECELNLTAMAAAMYAERAH